MKTLSLLFLATSLLFVNTFNASQESPELEEAATLAALASKLLEDGKYDDAVTPARRALQIREKLLPANDIRISASPIPAYPTSAKVHRYAGVVVVKVLVNEEGKVSTAKDMCNGPPYLREAAVDAAMKAPFSPTKLSGMPVKVYGVIFYNFVAR